MTDFKEEKAANGRFFFRKENRLLQRSDFQSVYQQGRVARRGLMHVFVRYDGNDGQTTSGDSDSSKIPTRLGITATRKAGNAVRRNRGRRLVREAFRHLLPELKPGYAIVINVMRAATAARYVDVYDQMRGVFAQFQLFRQPSVATDAPAETGSHHVP